MDNARECRHSLYRKSFKNAIRFLLTSSCDKNEFIKAFPHFDAQDQERLHRLFIQVITSLHQMIEDDFESLGLEAQVGTTLDTMDQLVEEQSLDILFSKETNIMDVAHNLSTVKKNEIQYLTGILGRAEEQNRIIRAHIELLKKGREEVNNATDVENLRSRILGNWTSINGL